MLMSIVPNGSVNYPAELNKTREDLITALEVAKEAPLVVKLAVLSRTFKLFSDQTVFENSNRVRSMAIYERDRLERHGRGIKHDSQLDRIQAPKSIS